MSPATLVADVSTVPAKQTRRTASTTNRASGS